MWDHCRLGDMKCCFSLWISVGVSFYCKSFKWFADFILDGFLDGIPPFVIIIFKQNSPSLSKKCHLKWKSPQTEWTGSLDFPLWAASRALCIKPPCIKLDNFALLLKRDSGRLGRHTMHTEVQRVKRMWHPICSWYGSHLIKEDQLTMLTWMDDHQGPLQL